MNARLPLLAFAFGLLLLPRLQAAPAASDPKTQAGPAITLQVKSIDECTERAKGILRAFFPDAEAKQGEKDLLAKLDALKGIDRKRPFAAYAFLDEGLLSGDLSKTSAMAPVPVTSEKEFIEFMMAVGLRVEKKGDVYAFAISKVPATIRFVKDYAFIGIGGDKLGATPPGAKDLIDAKEAAAAVLRVHVDRIPEKLRQSAINLAEAAFEVAKNKNTDPGEREFLNSMVDTVGRWWKAGLEDGKELVVRFDLDPKNGLIVVEKSIEPRPGSKLAKTYASWKPTTNQFAHLIQPGSAAHVLVQAPTSDDLRELLVKMVGLAAGGPDNLADTPEDKALGKEFRDTLKRTLKEANFDFAASLRGPDKNEQYTAIGAVSLKDTAALEQAIRKSIKAAPKKDVENIKLDAFKVNGVNVHEIGLTDEVPPPVQKIFTKGPVFVALAPNAMYFSFGAHAKDAMQEALLAKRVAKPAPLLQLEASGKKLQPLLKAFGLLEGGGADYFKMVAARERINLASIKLEGGERLVLRMELGFLPLFAASKPATAPPRPIEKKIEK
jgi:hypothetical protein